MLARPPEVRGCVPDLITPLRVGPRDGKLLWRGAQVPVERRDDHPGSTAPVLPQDPASRDERGWLLLLRPFAGVDEDHERSLGASDPEQHGVLGAGHQAIGDEDPEEEDGAAIEGEALEVGRIEDEAEGAVAVGEGAGDEMGHRRAWSQASTRAAGRGARVWRAKMCPVV